MKLYAPPPPSKWSVYNQNLQLLYLVFWINVGTNLIHICIVMLIMLVLVFLFPPLIETALQCYTETPSFTTLLHVFLSFSHSSFLLFLHFILPSFPSFISIPSLNKGRIWKGQFPTSKSSCGIDEVEKNQHTKYAS